MLNVAEAAARLGVDRETVRRWIRSERADRQVETVAVERIRSGATERTQDGEEALAELGIYAPQNFL